MIRLIVDNHPFQGKEQYLSPTASDIGQHSTSSELSKEIEIWLKGQQS
jgi:hypothetical protein